MRLTVLLSAVATLILGGLFVNSGYPSDDEGYLRFPTVYRATIVFSCEGDLWSVALHGGVARRLTHGDGQEILPRFSPDGKLLAFTGQYDGGRDVYVMPSRGGTPRRLTYHHYSDYVLTWTPDGKIVFRSSRYTPHGTYEVFTIEPEGGFPEKINLDMASLITFAPDGKRVAFNRFSREFRHWKRYMGGLAQDIWIGNLETLEFKKLTDYRGTDAFPMWVNDRIYFISDRDGIMNIYSMNLDGGDIKQHTFHEEYDVRWPCLGEDKIVYENGGDIWIYDIKNESYWKVEIEVPSDHKETREKFVDASKYVTDFEISPDAKRVAFCARGDIALLPVKEGRRIFLTMGSGVRDKFPRWSWDGKRIAYISDQTGEEEIYVVKSTGKDSPKQVTRDTQGWKFPPEWSPDGKHIAYADRSQTLFIVDVDGGKITAIDSSEVWEIRHYSWSPDGRYLAYAKDEENRFSSIFIYDTKDKEIIRVTDEFTQDSEPVWDPSGKYLYFLSDRTLDPFLSERGFEAIFDRMTKPYLVMLRSGEKSPFFPKEPEEVPEKEEEDKKEEEQVEVKIDVEGIMERIVEFPIEPGNYSNLSALKGKVFYLSRPSIGLSEGRALRRKGKPIYNLHCFDLEEKEDEVLVEGINAYRLATKNGKILYKRRDEYHVVSAQKQGGKGREESKKTKVDLSKWRIKVNPREEWKQIFNEAWRLQRDFYWAENMAGIDWEAVKVKYEKLLPRIATRADLNDLIGELIAELATSHTYVWGGDIPEPDRIPVGLLGADIVADRKAGYYRIKRIFPPDPSSPEAISPLTLSHVGVKDGDYILAVNGVELTVDTNFYSAFLNLADEEVLLTVNEKPTFDGARDVIVKTLEDEGDVRYVDWVRTKREFVQEQTDGKVGYLHVPDMGGAGLIEFARAFYPQLEKPGLIIDVRYNRGGYVSELLLEKLSQKLIAFFKPRKGRSERYPEGGLHAHLVVLCNQMAGSDGDIFTQAFKKAGLGTVIGMPTWGGVIGIRMDKPFVDGGMMSVPEFAWWEPEEGWSLENRGVVPDIEVENMPGDVLRGHDTQLEKAIEVIMHLLEEEPKQLPELPPIPDKSLKK